MKSSLRLRQASRLHLSSSPALKTNTFICNRCLSAPQRSNFSSTSSTRQDEPKPDFTQRLRRRIWGTDAPPGQKDPYRKLSPEEKAAEEAERAELTAQKDLERETASEIARRQSSGEYTPAETWQGLERVGGPKGWWEKAWDRENVYQGFLTEGRVGATATRDVEGIVRRAAVEIMALKQAGVSLAAGAKAEWSEEEFMEEIDIVRGPDGNFALREQAPDIIDELVEVLQRQPQVEEEVEEELMEESTEEVTAQEQEEQRILEELRAEEDAAAAEIEGQDATEEADLETVATTKTHDPIFLQLPLTDLEFRFALIKRLTYLLGTRIPDPRISSFQTLGDVVTYLSEKPKPKKLAEILLGMPELQALPNVQIRANRRRFVDKETEIGRWKVIEAELRTRGLPVRKRQRVYK